MSIRFLRFPHCWRIKEIHIKTGNLELITWEDDSSCTVVAHVKPDFRLYLKMYVHQIVRVLLGNDRSSRLLMNIPRIFPLLPASMTCHPAFFATFSISLSLTMSAHCVPGIYETLASFLKTVLLCCSKQQHYGTHTILPT